MDYRIRQEQQSLDPHDYRIRICVSGSRWWNDKRRFMRELVAYLEKFPQGEPILFISGQASTGADDFIISWCLKFGFPCKKMPADWDKNGNSAGHIRNWEMSNLCTHLIPFWNGKSTGTKGMIDICKSKKIPVHIVRIDRDEEPTEQPVCGPEGDSGSTAGTTEPDQSGVCEPLHKERELLPP